MSELEDSFNGYSKIDGERYPKLPSENLTRILRENTAGEAFAYVLNQPWRKPRNEGAPETKTKNLAFVTPQRLHSLISRVLRLQNLSKTRALVAYVQIHVALSEVFGTEGATGEEGSFDEPELAPSAPLREVYHYVTQSVGGSVEMDGPMIGVQVPVDLVRSFKSWTVRQEVTMSSVMLRYILFHVNQHRQEFGTLSIDEE